MPLKTFATIHGPVKHKVFPLLLLPSFASVLPEERVQNLQGRSDVLRDDICHRIQEETVCEYLSGALCSRGATEAARTGRCF